MSGGSFNYACFAQTRLELWEKHEDLTHLLQIMQAEVPRSRAAAMTKLLIENLGGEDAVVPHELTDVWRALEWWKSCDWSQGQFSDAVAAFESLPACDAPIALPGSPSYTCESIKGHYGPHWVSLRGSNPHGNTPTVITMIWR